MVAHLVDCVGVWPVGGACPLGVGAGLNVYPHTMETDRFLKFLCAQVLEGGALNA
jgi:hypothetical protein